MTAARATPPPEVAGAAPAVELFHPSQAPHLAAFTAELASRLLRQLEALPTDALQRLLRTGAEIAQRREEFERFRRRLAGTSRRE
jgi:hypothetical protein